MGMIRVDRSEYGKGLTTPANPIVPDAPAPGGLEVLGSAFGYDSDVVNALDWLSRPAYPPTPGYDVFEANKGTKYESNPDAFIGVQSERERRAVVSRMEREERQRQTVSAGGAWGFFASMLAGVLSPTTLIPVGGWLGAASKGGRVAVRAVEGAAVVGGSVAAQEALLHGAQETRTTVESVYAIAGSAILGSVLGGAAGLLTRAERGALEKRLIDVPGSAAEETAAWTKATAVGAQVSDSARGTGELKSALGAEKAFNFQDPLIRSQTSIFVSARNAVRDLAESPTMLAENADGIATSIGGAVETRVKMAHAPLAESLNELDTLYSGYFFGEQKRFAPLRGTLAAKRQGKMTYSQFKEAVSDAMWAGGRHPVPEVEQAARLMRERVFDPPKVQAEQVIPGFKEQVAAETADPGYLTRMWNGTVISARKLEFINILARHFEAQQAKIAQLEGGAVDPSIKDMTPAEIRSLAQETTNTILGHSPARLLMPSDLVAGPRGPLKERMLRSLPTSLVRDFVEKDIEVLSRVYTRTMAADTEIVRMFGSTDMLDAIAKINDEATALAEKATSEKASKKIGKQQEAAIRDLLAIRDRIRGNYAIPDNPDGMLVRTGRVIRNLNYLRLLGGMTLSAVPDLARPVMVHGMTRTMGQGFLPMVRNLKTFKLAAKEAKLAGTALDMVLDSRAMAIADVMDDYGRGSKFERAVEMGTRKFGVVSLMAPWNSAIKQFVGVIAQTRILQTVEKLAKGKATKAEIEYLASNGIDANMARRIWTQFDGGEVTAARSLRAGGIATTVSDITDPRVSLPKVAGDSVRFYHSGDAYAGGPRWLSPSPSYVNYRDGGAAFYIDIKKADIPASAVDDINGSYRNFEAPEPVARNMKPIVGKPEKVASTGHGIREDGVWAANTGEWTDAQAVQGLRAALVRDIDRTIITPGQDKPLWMSTEMGKVIGQFRSFNIASVQRTMIAGLQQRDAAALNGAMLMMALGSLSYYLKATTAGYEVSDDPVKWATEAFDRSGLAGWTMDANNIVEKLTRGHVGMSAFTGEQATRYASRNALGAILGPSFDAVGDAIQVTGSFSAGDWTAADSHALRKMVPLQNIFYLRQLLDQAEASANEVMGIPAGGQRSARSTIR